MALKIGTKLAQVNLERAGVLPETHIEPRLEAAAVSMYRSPWWTHVVLHDGIYCRNTDGQPYANQWNGLTVRRWGTEESNSCQGEIRWR